MVAPTGPALRRLAIAAALASCAAQAAETSLAEINVEAEKDDFDARRSATSTKLVYGREELDRMNELTVGDYLRRLPSVTFSGPPGTPKDVRVRGMDKGYTEILIDGEPVTVANLLDMKKDKDKYEYDALGRKTKFTQESERGGRAFFVALEGKW